MPGPRHLWAGEHATAEHDHPSTPPLGEGSARPAEEPRPETPPSGAGDRPPAWTRRRALALAAALLLAGGAGAAVTGIGGDSGSAREPVSLPAASGGKLPQSTVGKVYAAAGPSVVSVQVRQGGGQASGTGFVVDGEGTIVTNSHVVGSAREVRVRFGEGSPIPARVLGTDPSSDLAALRIDPDRAPSAKPLALADPAEVSVGDGVVAIGHPLGLDRTATAGIVSGLEREIQAPNGFSIDEVIQTDAPINPGNSGGPLLDARGRVIGVNSQIATAGAQGNIGIGFAVPSDTVRRVLPTLIRGERVERAYIGLTTSQAARGAAVEEVQAGGPAARAGVRDDDTVLRVDGRTVRDPGDLAAAVERRSPGDEVVLEVLRDGRTETLDLTLGDRPDRPTP